MTDSKFDILQGNIASVFFYYTIPTILGMVAMSSATIIDGIFLGNYVGATALAAVNLTLPFTSLLIGFGLMLSIGGSVQCGKYLGEGNEKAASIIFTKILVVIIGGCMLIVIPSLYFIDTLVAILGANEMLAGPVREYLTIILFFFCFLDGAICLSYFVRIDSQPVLSSGVMILGSILNIILDWFFIVILDMGIKGAALATVISYIIGFLLLWSHFFLKTSRLKLVWKKHGWNEVVQAAYNGLSEFANEISVGIVVFLFNIIMIRQMGVSGVAAFTIVNYLLYVGLMICYGVSDSLQSIISNNFGARNPERISAFLRVGVGLLMVVGAVLVVLIIITPESIIHIFVASTEKDTIAIALRFTSFFWPAFIFNGINIAFSTYFTAMQKPVHSASVALSRSLILPAVFLFILPLSMGDVGIYVSIPLAEIITFLFAAWLLYHNSPGKLIKSEYAR